MIFISSTFVLVTPIFVYEILFLKYLFFGRFKLNLFCCLRINIKIVIIINFLKWASMAIAAFLSSFLSRVQLQLALSRFQVVLDLNQLLEQKLCSIFHFLHFEIGGNHFLCFFNCFFSHLFLLKRIAIVD
jgi:hypothetical protein